MNYPIPLPITLVLQAIQQAANNLSRTKKSQKGKPRRDFAFL